MYLFKRELCLAQTYDWRVYESIKTKQNFYHDQFKSYTLKVQMSKMIKSETFSEGPEGSKLFFLQFLLCNNQHGHGDILSGDYSSLTIVIEQEL